MSKEHDLWREIDEAVVNGYVYHLEEVCETHGTSRICNYGTKIWFNGRVNAEQCQKIALYIRQKYDLKVDYHTEFCLVIWHSMSNQPS
jgi:hypothetical protein